MNIIQNNYRSPKIPLVDFVIVYSQQETVQEHLKPHIHASLANTNHLQPKKSKRSTKHILTLAFTRIRVYQIKHDSTD